MIPLDRVRELLAMWTERAEAQCEEPSGVEYALARDVLTLADALATAERERDEARAALASALAPNAADAALDDIAHACGCASWGYPAQVARDVLAVVADRDAARAEAAGLRAAITAERAVRAAWLATLPACATAPAEVVAAEAATGAALDAAGEGR